LVEKWEDPEPDPDPKRIIPDFRFRIPETKLFLIWANPDPEHCPKGAQKRKNHEIFFCAEM